MPWLNELAEQEHEIVVKWTKYLHHGWIEDFEMNLSFFGNALKDVDKFKEVENELQSKIDTEKIH